jgi:hypothetical protein
MSRAWLGALLLLVMGCDTAGFKDAYMSLDSAGKREREHFYTDTDKIYCIGKFVSGVEDVTVSATLRAQQLYDARDGHAYDVDYRLAISDEAPGKGEDIIVSFELERPESDAPYAAGKFVCELAIDGEIKERLPFEVQFPGCPEAPIYGGGFCAGFVLEGARCTGALSTPCVCGSDGLWSCS